jgi:three-Cys-motif partner protein
MNLEHYKGREQTFVKHYFLEQYLETVGFHLGYNHRDFFYVDSFSGPWQARGQALEDTSVHLALEKLNYVQNGLAISGRRCNISAIFVEKDAKAFSELEQLVSRACRDVRVHPIHGSFEENIPEILRLIGSSFALFFIDPKGWTGFGLNKITPLLLHRPGEAIINFMYDYINRFLANTDAPTETSFDLLFGTRDWRALRASNDRDHEIVEFYCGRIRDAGRFEYITSTPVLKPQQDRVYYHLVYGTHNPTGIVEFRATERKSAAVQEHARSTAQRQAREIRAGQTELDWGQCDTMSPIVERERRRAVAVGQELVFRLLSQGASDYEHLRGRVLEIPFYWESDLKKLLRSARAAGAIEIDGLGPRERVPKPDCRIRLARRLAGSKTRQGAPDEP